LLGGSFKLDLPAARAAIESRIARPLGLSLVQAARGILDVLDHNMVGTMRVVSVERGFDPRDFVLVPFGGAGPLHGCTLSRLIGSRTILIPPAPGVLSALGLLVSNLRAEFSRTCLQRAGHYDLKELAEAYADLARQASGWLDNENVAPRDRKLLLQASLRYKDQGFELDIPWAAGEVTPSALDATIKAFHDTHERLYTFALRDAPVEIVTLRVDAIGMMPAVKLPELGNRGTAAQAYVGQQELALPDGAVMAPVYSRDRLGVDAEVEGPAVLTQLDATTLLLPGQAARMDKYGSLIVQERSLPDRAHLSGMGTSISINL
jgi:N-methylhydantoinase A